MARIEVGSFLIEGGKVAGPAEYMQDPAGYKACMAKIERGESAVFNYGTRFVAERIPNEGHRLPQGRWRHDPQRSASWTRLTKLRRSSSPSVRWASPSSTLPNAGSIRVANSSVRT